MVTTVPNKSDVEGKAYLLRVRWYSISRFLYVAGIGLAGIISELVAATPTPILARDAISLIASLVFNILPFSLINIDSPSKLRQNISAYIMVFSDVALGLFLVGTHGGIASRTIILFIIPILMARYLWSKRGIYIVTALTIISYGLTLIVSPHGIYGTIVSAQTESNLFVTIIFYSSVLAIIAALIDARAIDSENIAVNSTKNDVTLNNEYEPNHSAINLLAGFTSAIGATVLIGWIFNIGYIKYLVPNVTAMNPVTACMFIGSGIAIVAINQLKNWTRFRQLIFLAFIGIVFFVAASVIYGYISPPGLQPDRWLFTNQLFSNRMAPNTATNFIFIGISLLLLQAPKYRKLSFIPALFSLMLALAAIIGYGYGVRTLYGFAALNPMALHSAICFLFVSIAIIILSRIYHPVGITRRITIALVGAVSISVLLGQISYRSTQSLIKTNSELATSNILIAATSKLRLDYTQAETGQRGYLLTGDLSYLVPYTSAKDSIQTDLASLQTLLPVTTKNDVLLANLNTETSIKLAELDKTITLRKNISENAALKVVNTGVGQTATTQINIILNDIDLNEAANQKSLKKLATVSTQNTYAVIALVSSVDLGLLLLVFFFISQAIADRIIAENIANEGNIRNNALLTSIGEGLIVIDEKGNISNINDRGRRILGYTRNDLIGNWFPGTIKALDTNGKEIDPFDRPILKALSTGKVVTEQTYYQRKDKSVFPVSLSISPVIINDKPIGAVEVFRDITKERELEIAKEEFVSLASHQLRTPATGVKAFLSMLSDGYAGKLTQDQQEFINKATDSNDRQLKIVDDMLQVARADSGRMVLAAEEFDVSKMIDDIIAEQTATIVSRSQKITFVRPNGPCIIKADGSKLRMAIENLISNASKYTPEKGKIKVSLIESKAQVIIEVADSGLGIAKKDVTKLFKRFSRIDNKLSSVVGGTGLGLYLTSKIVDLHKGKINVESVLSKGSKFTIRLPRN